MVNATQLSAVILAGFAVAIADALIKKTSSQESFWQAFKNPWMIAVVLLYFAQVAFFVYVFMNDWHLGIVGNLQMVIYSITVVLAGLLFFNESLSLTQGIGILLALLGVILMNF